MHRPVLVAPPDFLPVSVDEVTGYLPDSPLPEDVIRGLIRAATDHLDGWTGILGRCLVEQTWRQDYDCFSRDMVIPIGAVISVTGVIWRNPSGQISAVPESSYALRTDGGGRSSIRFDADFSFPTNLHESQAVSVTYRAGYPNLPEADGLPVRSGVPENVKMAIVMMVHHMKSMIERDLFETQESVVGIGATSRSVTPYVGESVTKAVALMLSGVAVPRI